MQSSKRRAFAFVVFGISLIVSKLALYDPIAAAERHEPQTHIHNCGYDV